MPDALRTDLGKIRFFLERRFPDHVPINLTVHRHYGSATGEIAYLVVMIDAQEQRRQVRSAGEAALRLLGYQINPRPGADVYDVAPSRDPISGHEAVQVLALFRAIA
jgi:hypothetical protein